jgi:phospholipid/cholesterol/gamma-HCH transport system permease protein
VSKNAAKPIPPQVTLTSKDGQKVLIFSGAWVILAIKSAIEALKTLDSSQFRQAELKIHFTDDFSCDTAGAWTLAKFLETAPVSESHRPQIPKEMSQYFGKTFSFPPDLKGPIVTGVLEGIGRSTVNFARTGRDIISFLGETVTHIYDAIVHKHGFRWATVAYLIEMVGLRAVPIICLISILVGAVLAYQGTTQLEKFGAPSLTVDFLTISLLREISVLLTSIIVAGRSGSSFTAQIGTMALNEEIDAIRMMGLNPFYVLVIPRVLALTISLPILVLVSMLLGGVGGMIVVRSMVGIPYGEFWSLFQAAVHKTTFWTGMCKAPIFALIIALIGCYRGLQVRGSAESVGIMTTRSVVESVFLVIVCDGILSIFFTALDW